MTAPALLAGPIAVGILLGLVVRSVLQRRVRTVLGGLALFLAPISIAVGFVLAVPKIGVWDAVMEGAIAGFALVATAHQTFEHKLHVLLTLVASVAGLLFLELGCRLLLPPAPAFPTGPPHLLVNDAIHAQRDVHFWEAASANFVCSIVYDGYVGALEPTLEQDVLRPSSHQPDASAHSHVLHVGDSLTFGSGVGRDQTFVAQLSRLEPGVEHVNAAVPATAPDQYLALIRRWTAAHRFDRVVMWVYGGNDITGLDAPSPCCQDRPLLAYDGGDAALRCFEPGVALHGPWRALRDVSPPPYLLRAIVGKSAAASYVAAMTVAPVRAAEAPLSTDGRFAHLAAIIAAAQKELAAKGIDFVVVALPRGAALRDPSAELLAPRIVDVARGAGAKALDASDALRQASATSQLFFARDPVHLNPHGHEVVASWFASVDAAK